MKVVKRWRRRKGITATGNQYLPGSPALLITSLNEGSQRSLLFRVHRKNQTCFCCQENWGWDGGLVLSLASRRTAR